MPDLFKEVLPSLLQHKKEVFRDDAEKDLFYNRNSYIINKALSMHFDCVLPANEMNKHFSLDGKLKHDFYLNILRGYRRPFNYAKAKKLEDLSIIKEYYGIGNEPAKLYQSLLTPEQIEQLKDDLNKGGVKK
jgi:hypothetical protein